MITNCQNCKNKSICKWINEKNNLEVKLDKIKLKEDSPFDLVCNCNFFKDESKEETEKEHVVAIIEEKVNEEEEV